MVFSKYDQDKIYNIAKIMAEAFASTAILCPLDQLGGNTNLTEDGIESIKGFICIMLYNGKANESYVETRLRTCNGLNENSLLCLPPNPDLVRQTIQRVYFQSST